VQYCNVVSPKNVSRQRPSEVSEESKADVLWWVRWSEHGEISVSSASGVESALESLWARFSDGNVKLVEIEAPQGTCLTIVAGKDETYLNYALPNGMSPSYISVGDRRVRKFSYYDWGVLVEVDGRHIVSKITAVDAVNQFVTTGGRVLPCAVQWEEV
jgi:hypothetical protein